MTAKPSSLPNIYPPPVKAPPPKKAGPSFNDSFAQFLQGGPSKMKPLPEPKTPLKTLATNVSAKVIVQTVEPSLPSELKQVTSSNVQQSQAVAPQQRVTTEKIEPYVSGQHSTLYANQVRPQNGQQAYYTINSNITSQPAMKENGQGYEQKQQSY